MIEANRTASSLRESSSAAISDGILLSGKR